jgi:hypothetical protein
MLREPVPMPLDTADVQIGINPHVLQFSVREQWVAARNWCLENRKPLEQSEEQPDGIRVVAGKSWLKPDEILS